VSPPFTWAIDGVSQQVLPVNPGQPSTSDEHRLPSIMAAGVVQKNYPANGLFPFRARQLIRAS
jgi:hypothetical protein